LISHRSTSLQVNLCFDTEYEYALVALLDSDELIMVEEEQVATWILIARTFEIWQLRFENKPGSNKIIYMETTANQGSDQEDGRR
jgi:hypothetical protein